MKSKYRIVRGDRIWTVVLAAFLPLGCIQSAVFWTNLTGGDAIEPVFTLTRGPLLILIDDRKTLVDQPRAVRELHKKISDRFVEYRVNHRVIPYSEWQRLNQQQRDYDKLTIRQIGEKLGADQVLYIQVERFTLHAETGAPIFKGEFIVRIKILTTERIHDVRLWPLRESIGRRLAVQTPSTAMDGEKNAADVAAELGQTMAQKIAELFYEHREFSE